MSICPCLAETAYYADEKESQLIEEFYCSKDAYSRLTEPCEKNKYFQCFPPQK